MNVSEKARPSVPRTRMIADLDPSVVSGRDRFRLVVVDRFTPERILDFYNAQMAYAGHQNQGKELTVRGYSSAHDVLLNASQEIARATLEAATNELFNLSPRISSPHTDGENVPQYIGEGEPSYPNLDELEARYADLDGPMNQIKIYESDIPQGYLRLAEKMMHRITQAPEDRNCSRDLITLLTDLFGARSEYLLRAKTAELDAKGRDLTADDTVEELREFSEQKWAILARYLAAYFQSDTLLGGAQQIDHILHGLHENGSILEHVSTDYERCLAILNAKDEVLDTYPFVGLSDKASSAARYMLQRAGD